MREDFHKVVIERARWGSRSRNLKTGWNTMQYDSAQEYPFPKTQSSSWQWNPNRKRFSDRLGPLQRYLDKQVGRPWRKVEGEIRKGLDLGTVTGRHLWDHAVWMVETECRMGRDGRPLRIQGGYPVTGLYVHPRSGLLLRPKPYPPDNGSARRRRLEQAKEIRLDDRTWAEKAAELWFLFIDTGRREEVIELRRQPDGSRLAVRVDRPVIRKKQASTAEIRRIRAALEASDPR